MSLLNIVFKIVTLPPMLAHELAHGLTAVPSADRVTLVLDDGRPRVGVDWATEREAAIWLSKLSPLILGLSSLLVVSWLLAHDPWRPDSIADTILAATLAIWWLIFSHVSPSDLERGEA